MKRFWIGKAVSIMLVSIILFTTIGCSSVNKWDLVLSKLGEKDIKFNSAIIRDNRTDEFETTIINDKGSIMMIQQQTNRNEAIVYGESMKVTVKFYMKILRDGVVEISQETFITTPSSSCTQHASGSFQAADYKKGNEVDWIHNEEVKFTLLGGMITITNRADKPTAFIASNLEKLEYQLSQIAPEVTMADLGFVAY